MLNKIKDYFKSLQQYSVTIIDIDENAQVISFSENGVLVKASFEELKSFCHFLPFMANQDIARFAYYLKKYANIMMSDYQLSNAAGENTICIEAEGRAGTILCFDLAVMAKTHFSVVKVIGDKPLINRFTQFGAFQIGLIYAELKSLGLNSISPVPNQAKLKVVS
jgi:hypothetical protein